MATSGLFILCFFTDLPAIEIVPASSLSATKSKSNQPDNGEYNRGNPQKMHRESGAKKDQNKEQCKYEYHAAPPSQLRFN